MLSLKDLSSKNWEKCANLLLPKDQEDFVAPNLYSIAESKFHPDYCPRVIYYNRTVIGFLMYHKATHLQEDGIYWLFRFMLAEKYQSRGFGKVALYIALCEMKKLGARKIRTMHKPANVAASYLYKKMGFKEIGALDDGDIEMEIDVLRMEAK